MVVEQEEAEQGTEVKYERLEDLPGVGPATAQKLRELGFNTVESVATAAIKELEPAGISEKKAIDVIRAARSTLALTFMRADELMKIRQTVVRLTTGSKAIDEVLAGGLETQTITEF